MGGVCGTHGITQQKMVEAGIARHQEETKGLARNRSVRIMGGKKRLEIFRPSTCINRKDDEE